MPVKISNQSYHFFQNLSDWSLHICYSVHITDSKACSCAASLCPSDRPTWHFTQMDNEQKDENATERQGIAYWMNINGAIEEIAGCGECLHWPVWATKDGQPEELSENLVKVILTTSRFLIF